MGTLEVMQKMISALLALGCAACFAPADEVSTNALYEPFLVEPMVMPSSPTNLKLAYFDVDLDEEVAASIYLAKANASVIEKVFGNFLISSSVGLYRPFDLNSRAHPLVAWASKSGAFWNEAQVIKVLEEQAYFAREASSTQTDQGFGYITKSTASFDTLHSILSSRLGSEKISDTCYFYRYEPADSERIITGFVINDQDGVLDLYDDETIGCVGQFLAKSMGLTVSQQQILALTGFDQQTDQGRPQPRVDEGGREDASLAGSESKPYRSSGFPTVEAQPDQEYLEWISDGGCVLASVAQRPTSRNETRLARSGCPKAPSAAAIVYPYFVYGKGTGQRESLAERMTSLREICRENVISEINADEFCEY